MAAREEKASKSNGDADVQQLKEFYELMVSEGLDSLELKDEESTVRLIRRHLAAPAAAPTFIPHAAHSTPAASPVPADVPPSNAQSIVTPLAGVFYRASSPTTPPFVKEGDVVDAGQTLCIVEAMKVMNEIKAESHCRISKIVAENSRPVTAGQPLFLVESA